VACGGDDDDAAAGNEKPAATTTTTSSTTTTTTVVSTTSTTEARTGTTLRLAGTNLTVKVTGTSPAREATLSCGQASKGTGFLAAPATAAKACDLLRTNDSVVKRLVYGPADGLLCTEIYGGPEVARISGTIAGQQVNAVINRANGCGISDWDNLAAILGPAG
jgi:hypothetical protein